MTYSKKECIFKMTGVFLASFKIGGADSRLLLEPLYIIGGSNNKPKSFRGQKAKAVSSEA